MCGVIVVDAVRSRSTCHGRDAYIHDHFLRYRHNFVFSISCSTVIYSPTICFLSREKPLVKPMAPGSIFRHIIFRSINQKNIAAIYLYLL